MSHRNMYMVELEHMSLILRNIIRMSPEADDIYIVLGK